MPRRSPTILAIAIAAALGAAGAARVTRLDGSRIAASEIDNTVSHLMQAADVTGVALALFNNRRPAYVKAYGFRDTDARAPLTIGDFARFIEALMAGRRLRAPTRRLMLTPQIRIVSKHQFPTLAPETTAENDAIRLSYGLGWGLFSTPYGQAFFKEGHDEGWRHYTSMFDEPGIGIVIMTNSSNGEGIFKALLETLVRNTFTPIEWEGFTPYDRPPGPKK